MGLASTILAFRPGSTFKAWKFPSLPVLFTDLRPGDEDGGVPTRRGGREDPSVSQSGGVNCTNVNFFGCSVIVLFERDSRWFNRIART